MVSSTSQVCIASLTQLIINTCMRNFHSLLAFLTLT